MRAWRWAAWAALVTLAGIVLASWCVPRARAADSWIADHASAYGRRSVWDWGYWPEHDGYIGRPTAWRWWCQSGPADHPTWATFTLETIGVAHLWLPLGTWLEIEVPLPGGGLTRTFAPVIDRGPYAWWGLDLSEGLVLALGWDRAGAPPEGPQAGERYFNRRPVRWRIATELGRDCGREGYASARPGVAAPARYD